MKNSIPRPICYLSLTPSYKQRHRETRFRCSKGQRHNNLHLVQYTRLYEKMRRNVQFKGNWIKIKANINNTPMCWHSSKLVPSTQWASASHTSSWRHSTSARFPKVPSRSTRMAAWKIANNEKFPVMINSRMLSYKNIPYWFILSCIILLCFPSFSLESNR